MLLLLLIYVAILSYQLYAARKRTKPIELRQISGVKAIDESIGRAVELGRPIAVDLHSSGATTVDAIVALAYLNYAAIKSAEAGAKILVGLGAPDLVPIAEDIVRLAYERSPKPELFNAAEMIEFISPTQFAYASGWLGLVGRTKPASILIVGSMGAEAMIVGESGMMVGAMQIAGSSSITNIPFFITSCDYVIMGEEHYVGAAVLSGDMVQLGSILGQDIFKIFTLALIMIGAILSTVGFTTLADILKV